MKRLMTLILLIISIALVSCNKEQEHKVEIFVNSDIVIDINEVDEYMWKSVITIRVDGEFMPYGDTVVSLREGEELIVDTDVEFLVSYPYDGKVYHETFTARIYQKKNYKILNLHYLDSKKDSVSFEESYNLSDCNTNVDGYTFLGWYKDPLFTDEYSLSIVSESISLYGKWRKNSVESMNSLDNMNSIMDLYIESLITSTPGYVPYWNKEGFKGRWNYIDGVFLNSIVNLYYKTQETRYIDFVVNYVNYYINSDGVFINPETSEFDFRGGELDSICESRILFDLYEYTKDSRYLNAIGYTTSQLDKIPKTINGINFSHKEVYLNQIWLDGMYMYVPFLARCAKTFDQSELFKEIRLQYQYIRENMYDEDKKLYYHGHDTSKSIFWADGKSGNSKSFWLRSMGWFIVSLVDVLEYYPEGEDKEYLISLLKEAVDGILLYQDSDSKMFYQIVDKDAIAYLVPARYLEKLKNKTYMSNGVYVDKSIANYLESSGSSMIAYTLLKGSKLGYLDDNYYDIGKDIFEGVYSYCFIDNSLKNICITAGLGPENNTIRDGSIYYYLAESVGSDDAKGVGPFIMAYLEYKEE